MTPPGEAPGVVNTPTTMRGVQLVGHGGPEQLLYRTDLPVPRPGPRDVLVRVGAAAVNNTDINTRTGWYSKRGGSAGDASWTGDPIAFPRIQGIDVCGRIVAVGESTDERRVGERVLLEPCLWEAGGRRLDDPWFLGSECDGGFADYTVVASVHAHRVDSTLGDVELASFPCSCSTAENMLSRAGVEAGERVLVTGASGGVGSAAVQLAKARGAQVIALTTPAKAEALLAIGADEVVYRGEHPVGRLGPNAVDVVIDLVAGELWPDLLELLRPGGRYAASGAIGGPLVQLDVRTLYLKDLSLFGCTRLDPGVFANLVRRIEQGDVLPLVAARYRLDQIREAQARFEEKNHVGKIVLAVDERNRSNLI